MTTAKELQEQGIKLYGQQDYEAAARAFQQAQEAYADLGQDDMVAEMQTNIGLVHRALGENQQALDIMQIALRSFQAKGDVLRAAQVMGNSLRMWDMVYDREHKQRAAQAAIDNLAQWRQAVMAAVTPPHSEAALSSLLDSGELTDSDDVEMTLDIAKMTSEDFEAFLRSDSYE